jgi:hypothetical protein
MTEVHHRPSGGKGADPSTARRALRRFVKAAQALDEAWNPLLEVPSYPRYLPAFDKVASDLTDWRDEAEDRPYTEPREIEPLNLADADAIRAWLSELRAQIVDATAAGKDALRRRGRRQLGRYTARRTFRDACRGIEQMLAAAERGVASSAADWSRSILLSMVTVRSMATLSLDYPLWQQVTELSFP